MDRSFLRTLVCLVVGLAVAGAASARIYSVRLHNGETVTTHYQPMTAPWDEGKAMLLTSVGNWVSLSKADIAGVELMVETEGYGDVLDNTTVDLGLTANDRPTPDPNQSAAAQQDILQLLGNQPVHNTPQFAEPSEAAGIPVWMTNSVTPPLGTSQPVPTTP